MTVDATITLDSATDVLAIPSGALQRGDTVLITAASPSAANAQGEAVNGYVSVEVVTGTGDGQLYRDRLRPAGGGRGGLHPHRIL